MEQIKNKVWIVSNDEDCFAVFSSKAYAEEYKKSIVEQWVKSMTRDVIPPRLNNRKEIEMHAKDYPNIIRVNKDRYELIQHWASHSEGNKEFWYYRLLSNADWDDCYERYVDDITIKEHAIVK